MGDGQTQHGLPKGSGVPEPECQHHGKMARSTLSMRPGVPHDWEAQHTRVSTHVAMLSAPNGPPLHCPLPPSLMI